MKSNTIFHCGTDQIKYSCFLGKDKKWYLRETVAGATHFKMRRIRRSSIEEYFQMQNLEAKLNWCAERMAEEVRKYSLPFAPATTHAAAA